MAVKVDDFSALSRRFVSRDLVTELPKPGTNLLRSIYSLTKTMQVEGIETLFIAFDRID